MDKVKRMKESAKLYLTKLILAHEWRKEHVSIWLACGLVPAGGVGAFPLYSQPSGGIGECSFT